MSRPSVSGRRQIPVSTPEEPGELGTTEFEIVAEVGAGGMGRVVKARQLSLDREVAIKQLSPREGMRDAVEHFESEACITAVLDHPNIVPVYDMGADQGGTVFYSMKMIEGTPWSELLRRGGRDPREDMEILIEVANAVAFAHSRGIIHRDIKPANVMIGEFSEVTLVDWGLACSLRPVRHPARIYDLSQVMITCGTPAYMPPEISTGQREWVGTWTDVYMLGAVLFEVLYGLPPHESKTAIGALEVASRNEYEIPAEVPADRQPYHEVLKPVLMRALATHPEQRQEDGKAFADAVKQALTHLDAAELANQAIQAFKGVEGQQASAQRARKAGGVADQPLDRHGSYRALSRVVAVLEQALTSWAQNPTARHYIVEAHLLHAFIALDGGDLSVARQHLEALEHLPAHITPAPDQTQRAGKLHKRLEREVDALDRKEKWMFRFQVSAISLALLLFAGAVIATFLISSARDQARRERNHLSKLLIGTASDGIEAELQSLLQPVRGSLLGAADWVKGGRLQTEDPEVLSAFFVPLIDGFPVISSIIRADMDGREYMLLRTDGGWQTRWRAPGEPAHSAKLAHDGTVVETWEEAIDYDPKSRPWYTGALEAEAGAIHWTEPYTFFTTKEPGITASMTATGPDGARYVLGVDMLLTDLSEFTMRMADSEDARVFVLTNDFRVVGLPRSDRFRSEEQKLAAVLTPLRDLGEPVSAAALDEWDAAGRIDGEPFRFVLTKQAWWSGFRRYELGKDRPLWIGVVLPETDFEVTP